MKQVFLDTVGMIALWDETDQWHVAARAAYGALLAEGRHLVTTSFVLCECANAAARRPYRADVSELRKSLIQAQLLVDPTP
jgi:predicted nucleic acid-binding protein